MNTRREGSMIVITPDEGKYLTNGDVYTDGEVYMNYYSDVSIWEEIDYMPEPPEPPMDEPITDTEALDIITSRQ